MPRKKKTAVEVKAKVVGTKKKVFVPQNITPMSPWKVKKELEALSDLYENGDVEIYTSEWFDRQREHIIRCSWAWVEGGNENQD